ncbi:hypothetical protein IQ273_20745 [Nodosilinea sp. LEGE 07298]|jgi:hypothetical protein|uniref:DUF6335 family protein n=1 Tax=Nodosilinea sp. LEGE 07298 TaxID=2777970 RepID=UPI001880519F|nr:DUF6335 family protein [Nodosilinea sp. LEGE 07298]MBE9111840.1 hypothetical protein [Nodosilinea sp. LEGE 07298]
MSQKKTDSANVSSSQAIDKTPPTADQPVTNLSPAQAAEEAARTGREDNSAMIGAEVPDNNRMASGSPTTANDPDVMAGQAKVVGEEAIGGTTPTPDQNNIDEIAAAAGIDTQAEEPVAVKDEMDRRDDQRFELDPDSKDPAS